EMNHVPRELVVAHDDRAADHAACGVLHGGKRLWQNLLERRALVRRRGDAGAKLLRLRAELVVRQRLVGDFKLVNARDNRTALLDEFFVVPAGETFEEKREHER